MLRIEEQTHRLAFRVDEIQRAAIEHAAASCGLSMSAWVREAIEAALKAQSEAEKESFREPQKVPQKPAAQSPEVSKFLRAVRSANQRDRAFR